MKSVDHENEVKVR